MPGEALGCPLQQGIERSFAVVHESVLRRGVTNQLPTVSGRTRSENLNEVNYLMPLA